MFTENFEETSSKKQAEIYTVFQSKQSNSGKLVGNVSTVTKEPNDDDSKSYGGLETVQTLLFFEALREANISFRQEEVKLDRSSLKISFRNISFSIIIPLKILRACYRLQPWRVHMCNTLTSHIENEAKLSNKKEEYYLQVIYFVIMNIMPPFGKKYNTGQYFP